MSTLHASEGRTGGSPRLAALAVAVLALFQVAALWSQTGAAIDVEIVAPATGAPAFGVIEVVAEVSSGSPLEYVECFVDGRRLGRLRSPPFRWIVDVGEDNEERVIEVSARSVVGGTGRADLRTPRIEVDEVMDVELLQLYAVVEKDGVRVTDLTRDAFRLVDDRGRRQEIVTFEGGDLPISATLLVDSSESMQGGRLAVALRGIGAFADGMMEKDEAMLVLFSDQILRLTDFAAEPAALVGDVDGVQALGSTSINDHLYYALNRVDQRLGRRVVVLFSDGDDVTSLLSMEKVLWRARRSQAVIYWIRLDESEATRDRPADLEAEPEPRRFNSSWRGADANAQEQRLLRQAVADSGGRVLTVRRLEDLESGFADVMDELRDQYVIGFYPTSSRHDGSWRRYDIKVRGGYRVRSRGGFIDD